jgi:hypothetical protein
MRVILQARSCGLSVFLRSLSGYFLAGFTMLGNDVVITVSPQVVCECHEEEVLFSTEASNTHMFQHLGRVLVFDRDVEC